MIGTMWKSGFSPFSTPSFKFNTCCFKNFKAKPNHAPVNLDDRVPESCLAPAGAPPDHTKPFHIPIKTCWTLKQRHWNRTIVQCRAAVLRPATDGPFKVLGRGWQGMPGRFWGSCMLWYWLFTGSISFLCLAQDLNLHRGNEWSACAGRGFKSQVWNHLEGGKPTNNIFWSFFVHKFTV